MSQESERFLECWNKFSVRLKGKLQMNGQKHDIALAHARLLLEDEAGEWEDAFDEGGRWLRDLTAKDPAMGEEILRVIHSMAFTEPEAGRQVSEAMDYAVPVAGAAVGTGIAVLANASTFVTILSAVAPAAALYPLTRQVRTNMNTRNADRKADAYIAQLDKYRDEILGILG